MAQNLKRTTSAWKSLRTLQNNPEPRSRKNTSDNLNPWKIEAGEWSVSPRNISFINAPRSKRKRAFTGQLISSNASKPGLFNDRILNLRIGISLFIVFDLLLLIAYLISIFRTYT